MKVGQEGGLQSEAGLPAGGSGGSLGWAGQGSPSAALGQPAAAVEVAAAAVAAEAFADAVSSGWSPCLDLLEPSETWAGADPGRLQLCHHQLARLSAAAAAAAACEAGSTLLQPPVPEVGTDQDGPGPSLLVVAAAVAVVVSRSGDGRVPASGDWCCVLGSSAVLEPLLKPCLVQKAAGAAEVAFLASALALP